jgi:threonine/homoserine/homoserine lactone efflux protein
MFTLTEIVLFCAAALILVLTPGPNMIYCVSRTLVQGPRAGFISLAGVVTGFLVHLLAASLGLTALLMAVPSAFNIIKFAGAAYLMWLAWQAIKPGGAAPFEARTLPADAPGKLYRMGFITNLLNPKVAMFYLSFFPQFIHPERGSVLLQSLTLGAMQITVCSIVNSGIILCAAGLTRFLSQSPAWIRAQRWIMGAVLGGLAVRLAMTERQSG